jgi:hypothetical protein
VCELRQANCCLQGGLLKAAEKGDAGKVHRCLAAGVSVNCKDEVGAFSLLPMPARNVGVIQFVRWGRMRWARGHLGGARSHFGTCCS